MSRRFPTAGYRRVWYIWKGEGEYLEKGKIVYYVRVRGPDGEWWKFKMGVFEEALNFVMNLTRCQYGDGGESEGSY